jgi:hypothetical protein
MLLAEVTTVISVDLKTTSCEGIYDTNPSLADNCSQVGFERHSVALLLLELLKIGVVVLGLALLVDLPASDDTGVIGRDYAEAHASAGTGLYFEVIGGALAVLAGLMRVIRPDD